MVRKHFSQKQKLSILRSAEQTTVKDAASIADVHFTTVYDWKKQVEVLGEQGFLAYQVPRPGRGIKKISPQKEQAVVDTWEANPEYGPGQVRNQLRRQRIRLQSFTQMLGTEKGIFLSSKTVGDILIATTYDLRKHVKNDQDFTKSFGSRFPMVL